MQGRWEWRERAAAQNTTHALRGNRPEHQEGKEKVQAGEQTGRGNITVIDETMYHQGDSLLQEVEALALRHPESMLVHSLRSDSDGYASEIMIATIEHGINDLARKDKYRLLLSFGQHGRELITSEVALTRLNLLVGEKDPAILNNESLKAELRKMIIKIVPMENYNGRKIVESGHLCERKNVRKYESALGVPAKRLKIRSFSTDMG